MPRRLIPSLAVLPCLLCAVPALAQVAPSPGAVLRQLEPAPGSTLPLPQPGPDQGHDRPKAPTGPVMHVMGFSFEGNHLIASGRLAGIVAGFANRDLAPDDLRQATDAVAREYRRHGWLARVIVPAQTVAGGMVRLQVIEGRVGKVEFSDDTPVDSLRVKPQRILDRVEDGLTPGEPVSVPALTRGVLLAGDLSGVTVTGSEQAGEGEGVTDIVLQVQNEPPFTGDVSVDNYGQAGVGSERLVGHGDLNSPFGRGEQFDGIGIVTPDLQYARGALALPLSANGLKLNLDAAALHYAVDAPEYRLLDPRGSSTLFDGALEYQWIRATDHNLAAGIDLTRKSFDSTLRAIKASDYHVYDATLYLTGNLYDGFLEGAVTTADIRFGHGWVQMHGSPNEYWDRINADTQGQFNVLRWRVDRTQQLPHDFSVYAGLSGQLSYQNLDPAEMFYPGGPFGVASSAVAADGGSSGQLADLELRWAGWRAFGTETTLKLRYDAAHVRIYANDQWPAAPQPNSYSLQGVGVGAQTDAPWGMHLTVMAEHRVGGDAGAEVPDNGLTGARRDTRVWASLEKRF